MIIAIADGATLVQFVLIRLVRHPRTARRKTARHHRTDALATTQSALHPHFDTTEMIVAGMINHLPTNVKHHPRGMGPIAQRSEIIQTEVVKTPGALTMTMAEQAGITTMAERVDNMTMADLADNMTMVDLVDNITMADLVDSTTMTDWAESTKMAEWADNMLDPSEIATMKTGIPIHGTKGLTYQLLKQCLSCRMGTTAHAQLQTNQTIMKTTTLR